VLNTISTGAMIRMGYVYGNLMVNVQPRNAKLEARAIRIIVAAGGVGAPRAAELLGMSGRSVKTAIVMARLGMDRGAAEHLLSETGGRISVALASGNK